MITIIILLLMLLIPSIYFKYRSNISIEKIIPCTIISIILIIYIFGLFNFLKIGVYSVIILELVFTILLIKLLKQKKIKIKEIIKLLLKPSMAIWIIGIIIIYFYYKGRMIISWDEFSHWGDVVKMMHYNDIFNTNPASLSAARGYPPIMSIFQYFVEKLSFNGYQEHYLFSSYHIFVLSLILPFIRHFKWKDFLKILLVLLILIIVPTIFFNEAYYYYNIIYIDPFLAILFSYLMANIYITKKYKKFELISFSLTFFALTLTKDIAPVFSLISLFYLFLNIVIAEKNYKILKKINRKNIKQFFSKTKPIWIFLLVIIISYISWKINVKLNVKEISGGYSSTIKEVIKALLNLEDSYRITVINNYVNCLSNFKITNMGNIYLFSGLLILFSIVVYKNEKVANKNKSKNGFICIFLGEVLYIFLMLILYLLLFSEYEATTLASLDRYLGIYLMAIIYFFCLISIYRSIEQKKYKSLIVLFVIILLNTNMSSVILNFYDFYHNKQNTQITREKYISAANSIRSKVDTNKKYKFYIIIQKSVGLEKWMLRYELRDILKEMNEGFNWSLGEKYGENDIWTLDISKDEFEDTIFDEEYDYIYLYNVDEKFIERYGSLFKSTEIKNGQLYKVNRKKKTIDIVE